MLWCYGDCEMILICFCGLKKPLLKLYLKTTNSLPCRNNESDTSTEKRVFQKTKKKDDFCKNNRV